MGLILAELHTVACHLEKETLLNQDVRGIPDSTIFYGAYVIKGSFHLSNSCSGPLPPFRAQEAKKQGKLSDTLDAPKGNPQTKHITHQWSLLHSMTLAVTPLKCRYK
jgi:hypothetical protein